MRCAARILAGAVALVCVTSGVKGSACPTTTIALLAEDATVLQIDGSEVDGGVCSGNEVRYESASDTLWRCHKSKWGSWERAVTPAYAGVAPFESPGDTSYCIEFDKIDGSGDRMQLCSTKQPPQCRYLSQTMAVQAGSTCSASGPSFISWDTVVDPAQPSIVAMDAHLGERLQNVGDLNGDEVDDFLVSYRDSGTYAMMMLCMNADGSVNESKLVDLKADLDPDVLDNRPVVIVPLGDIDANGAADFGLGDASGNQARFVVVLMEQDLTVKNVQAWEAYTDFTPSKQPTLFGRDAVSLGDMDGDGKIELAFPAGTVHPATFLIISVNPDGTIDTDCEKGDANNNAPAGISTNNQFCAGGIVALGSAGQAGKQHIMCAPYDTTGLLWKGVVDSADWSVTWTAVLLADLTSTWPTGVPHRTVYAAGDLNNDGVQDMFLTSHSHLGNRGIGQAILMDAGFTSGTVAFEVNGATFMSDNAGTMQPYVGFMSTWRLGSSGDNTKILMSSHGAEPAGCANCDYGTLRMMEVDSCFAGSGDKLPQPRPEGIMSWSGCDE